MMNPSTVEQLKALRLVGMLEAWSEQQTIVRQINVGLVE